MSRCVNKVILVGHVGSEPEIRTTQKGTKVANFSLATNRFVPDGEEGAERTDWHRLTAWNKVAQVVEDFVRTGSRVYVEGRLEYDSFERDGNTVPTVDVTVRDLVLLTPKAAEVAA